MTKIICREMEFRVAPMESKDKARKDDKLEVNVDGVWYDAKMCLRKDGIATVHYDGFLEDVDGDPWDAEKIKGFETLRDHIRVKSEALHDEACHRLKTHDVVCAMRPGPREAWYDATITSIQRRLHKFGANGEICTYSFTIEWLCNPEKGQPYILGCGGICLHSTKDVKTHPLVLDILRHGKQDDVGEGSPDDETDDQEEDRNKEDKWMPEQELGAVCPSKRLKGAKKPTGKMRGQVPFLSAEFVLVC